jgi:hypothetical protein
MPGSPSLVIAARRCGLSAGRVRRLLAGMPGDVGRPARRLCSWLPWAGRMGFIRADRIALIAVRVADGRARR